MLTSQLELLHKNSLLYLTLAATRYGCLLQTVPNVPFIHLNLTLINQSPIHLTMKDIKYFMVKEMYQDH